MFQESNLDFVIPPVLIMVIMMIASFYATKYRDKSIRKYFLLGIFAKLIGGLILAIITKYYYQGGDSFYIFQGARSITENFYSDFSTTLKIIFNDSQYLIENGLRDTYFRYTYFILSRDASFLVVKVAGIFGLISFNNFLGTSVLFGIIGFIGNWKIYKAFLILYPNLKKELAYCILFIPTNLLWSSGIVKETIAIFFLGYIFYSIIQIQIKKRLSKIPILIISILGLAVIKFYILLAVILSALIWTIQKNKNQIRNKYIRNSFMFAALIICLVTFLIGFNNVTKQKKYKRYSIENVKQKSEDMVRHYSEINKTDINVNTTNKGVSSIIFNSPITIFNITYRPFIWEARNPIMLIIALENLILFMFSIIIIFKRNLYGTFKQISTNYTIQFCIVYSALIALIIGISNTNFGTITRYRVVYTQFLLVGFMLIYKLKRYKKRSQITLE